MTSYDHKSIDAPRGVFARVALDSDFVPKPTSARRSIYLDSERVLLPYADYTKAGALCSFRPLRAPLSNFEAIAKRAIDIFGAVLGIALLAPLFAIVALLIKLDSKGPVFFTQRRYGLRQDVFWILKFRSMSSLEDGSDVVQAKKNDPRITRVGRWLRSSNIDELPQLVNVLRGDMSLVGPRPHALVHDMAFARKIARYSLRHRMKPGITGWAQINGLRGEIRSDEEIRDRVAHDIYYIDHWSLLFDLRILLLTFISRKVFHNAY
jgi:exopolysaccharide biosynthesis polyprenyl glycosylphosphotransferase